MIVGEEAIQYGKLLKARNDARSKLRDYIDEMKTYAASDEQLKLIDPEKLKRLWDDFMAREEEVKQFLEK